MNLQTPRVPRACRAAAGRRPRPSRGPRTVHESGAPAARRSSLAFLLAFPWVATPFFTFQIGAQALALGLIALSLTFLGGYGGMISLAQMTVAGIAGYMVGDLRHQRPPTAISLGWPWWLAVPARASPSRSLAATFIGWLSVRTEGIYTIMITLAIGVAFYYLCAAELRRVQRLPGLAAGASRRRWLRHLLARPAAVLLPRAVLVAGGLLFVSVPAARAVRHRAAGHPRQPAPHERARLQRHRAPRRGLRGRRRHRRRRRRAVHLVQRPGHAGLGGHRLADQHPDHRGARRHAPSDRRVPRRDRVRAAAELRHRRDRPRALQPGDRRRVPRHRAVFAATACSAGGRPCRRVPRCRDHQPRGGNHMESRKRDVRSHARRSGGPRRRWRQRVRAGRPVKIGLLATLEGPFAAGGAGRHARRRARRAAAQRHGGGQQDRDHQGLVRRQARRGGERDPQARRAGQGRHHGRPAVGRRGHRGQGLLEDPAQHHVHQRLLGRAGHDARQPVAELLPLQHRRRRSGWWASARPRSTRATSA